MRRDGIRQVTDDVTMKRPSAPLASLTSLAVSLHASDVGPATAIEAEHLPPSEEVRRAVARLCIARAWLTTTHTIVWFVDEPGGERLHVASSSIDDPAVQEAAEQWHPAPPRYFRADQNALRPYFAELGAEMDGAVAVARSDAAHLRELAEEIPVIDFVNAMLSEASLRRASDVHIEPFEDKLSVRFRIDGVLTLWRTAPRLLFESVSSRIKILSGMDIAERRLPQDGRQTLKIAGRDVDARVSSLPTTWGESIVLRFLGKHNALPDFDQLGIAQDQQALVRGLLGASSGMVLVTGPTGSGKTTTVYRMVTELNDGLRKIVSIEDPVEINLPGVLQTQVRSDIGLGFATGLRSILRQDPDIILVGEIRDAETAAIAVQAALTGHLVISTLHTNAALSALTRLLDLGAESYFVADVLRGIIGQRLARRLCAACCVSVEGATEEAFARGRLRPELMTGSPSWRQAAGCLRCSMTGYAGRIGVFEATAITPGLRDAIRNRADESTLEAIARETGYRAAFEDGVLKARAGITTLVEVQRALGGSRP